ncbi:TrbG/VirB9 family P-type conjugative transfer protein [Cognatilysobacter lacus]|uniref:Type IV secretion system protein VirB9 n=1 Tax=Cognatilysobacter lacus TaxID=1643323 RepID=A0A5D8ZA23_9GAMM|nr:TrbG/VirB9 family P-type conjugative transfer protein [Lysobacter lacus]TZF91490.1 type IV secretion system protein VirB9 [Lysobacter lacus]
MNRFNAHALAGLLGLLLASVSSVACAQAVQEYDYVENRIYPVRTGLGIATQIELSPSENVIDYSTGFSNGWDISRRDNVFYVKPKNVDVDTNLLIRTETHSYILELRVVATNWKALDQAKDAGVQYKVRFHYPNDAKFKNEAAQKAPELSVALDSTRAYNFDYEYSTRTKFKALVPVNVYDDGQFTYIQLGDMTPFPTGSFPAVFGSEKDNGDEFVVNTTVQGNTIVVHGTYRYLVIRHGNDVVGLRRNPHS